MRCCKSISSRLRTMHSCWCARSTCTSALIRRICAAMGCIQSLFSCSFICIHAAFLPLHLVRSYCPSDLLGEVILEDVVEFFFNDVNKVLVAGQMLSSDGCTARVAHLPACFVRHRPLAQASAWRWRLATSPTSRILSSRRTAQVCKLAAGC